MTTNTLRKNLPPMPDRIKALPISDKGYPVPWFVKWIDGVPDFRVVDEQKLIRCLREGVCQICAQPMGKFKTFVGGPLMITQRVSLEPAMHKDCALWAVQVCPFMVLPKAKKRTAGLHEDVLKSMDENDKLLREANAVQLENNPGVFGVYTTTGYGVNRERCMITMGPPAMPIEWFSEGKPCGDDVVQAYLREAVERLAREHNMVPVLEGETS